MNGIIIPLINISENYNPIKTELGTTIHHEWCDIVHQTVWTWKCSEKQQLEIIIILISQEELWIFTKDF